MGWGGPSTGGHWWERQEGVGHSRVTAASEALAERRGLSSGTRRGQKGGQTSPAKCKDGFSGEGCKQNQTQRGWEGGEEDVQAGGQDVWTGRGGQRGECG